MSDLINVNQLKDVLALTVSTSEPPEYPSDTPIITSDTIHADFSNMSSQTIIALQCKSCGGIIDKGTMTCRHCGMTYMLINSNEINPRLIYPDF